MSAEQMPPGTPNPYLVQRYQRAMDQAEQLMPTGDPGSLTCHHQSADGSACGQRRVLTGSTDSTNRALICPTCDVG